MSEIKLITVNPGHFHAALVQKEMYPDISSRASVYGPLAPDLIAHLERVARFNTRAEKPTSWELDIHARPDYLETMLADKPGNVVILAGRNRNKIDLIEASISAGLNVLADKPLIIRAEDLPRLEAVFEAAQSKGLIAIDIMTERFEVTSLLQRTLVQDPEIFGDPAPGSVEAPCVTMASTHHLMKLVAGVPLTRPPWYFDIREQGEGLSDVGTHLVDLVQWTLFPDQTIDRARDVELHGGKRWPTVLTREQFRRVTGEEEFPESVAGDIKDGRLEYYCNNQVSYSVRGVHVKLDVLWDYEAPAGAGDTHFATYRGTNSSIEIRQGAEENYRPELYVKPNRPEKAAELSSVVSARLAALRREYPGASAVQRGEEVVVSIPDELRIGHEAHFAQVARLFFACLKGTATLPAWETPNMLAKYFVTTNGVRLDSK